MTKRAKPPTAPSVKVSPRLALDSRERSTDGWNMTELEEAELRLRRARAQRQWAARQNDDELEEAFARESHHCWVEIERLKAQET
jgi:hypothetical protein